MKRVIAIDPGQKKCGLLLADLEKELVLDGRVVATDAVIDLVVRWSADEDLDGIVLGNGTSSKYWENKLKGFAPIEVVEESGTTLRARDRYWEIWPPRIFIRWLPRGMLVPLKHLDAVAALVLLEDHLDKKLNWSGLADFRISP